MKPEPLKVPADAWGDRPKAPVIPIAYRCREAAAALGISERSLWQLAKEGEVPVARLGKGGILLFPVESLRRWVLERAEAQAAQNAHGGAQGETP